MLEIQGLHHSSVIITDLEQSRRFYGELLGMKEIAMPKTFDFIVIWYELNGQHIHLLLKDEPDTISPRHFALLISDAESAREYFKERGVPMRETTPIPGADRFFIDDPDGNLIELIEWKRDYDPAQDGVSG